MAGITNLEKFKEEYLLGILRGYEETIESWVDAYLPDKRVFSKEFAYDIIKKTPNIAAYIGEGSEPPVIDRDKVGSMAGELAKFGIKHIVTESELYAIHNARTSEERSETINALLIDATKLLDAMFKRVLISKYEALLTGKLNYNHDGVKLDIDFGVPAENKPTAAVKWDALTATPVSDLLAWNDAFTENQGDAALLVISSKVMRILQKNEEVIALSGLNTSMVTEAVVKDVLRESGLPPVNVISKSSIGVQNHLTGKIDQKTFFNQDTVILLQEDVGSFLIGPNADANFDSTMYLAAYDLNRPKRSVIEATAVGFPVIKNPHGIFIATVLGDYVRSALREPLVVDGSGVAGSTNKSETDESAAPSEGKDTTDQGDMSLEDKATPKRRGK